MAYSPSLAREWYENLPVRKLKRLYKQLEKNYRFKTKKDQIKYILKNYLYKSDKTNYESQRIALEALLKEKTGKEYTIEPRTFDISVDDVINYIEKKSTANMLSDFFNKLDDVREEDKKKLLFILYQDKNIYNEFISEVSNTQNVKETYDKYYNIAIEYDSRKSMVG